MDAQTDPAHSRHPAVAAALGIAGLAFVAGALAVIAYMLDWLPWKPQLPGTPTGMANPGQQVAGSAPDVALLPGETLVAPSEAPARTPAIESAKASPPAMPRPTAPKYATTPSPQPASAPARPNYTRDELAARPSSERSSQDLCVNCGAITSITSVGPDWEVRVRFDDGSSETLRYPDRPRLRAGDRVHLEDGRLTRD
jgi:hypothetical protein